MANDYFLIDQIFCVSPVVRSNLRSDVDLYFPGRMKENGRVQRVRPERNSREKFQPNEIFPRVDCEFGRFPADRTLQRDCRRGNLHPVSGRPRHSRHFVISDTYFRLYAFKNEELIGTRLPEFRGSLSS